MNSEVCVAAWSLVCLWESERCSKVFKSRHSQSSRFHEAKAPSFVKLFLMLTIQRPYNNTKIFMTNSFNKLNLENIKWTCFFFFFLMQEKQENNCFLLFPTIWSLSIWKAIRQLIFLRTNVFIGAQQQGLVMVRQELQKHPKNYFFSCGLARVMHRYVYTYFKDLHNILSAYQAPGITLIIKESVTQSHKGQHNHVNNSRNLPLLKCH